MRDFLFAIAIILTVPFYCMHMARSQDPKDVCNSPGAVMIMVGDLSRPAVGTPKLVFTTRFSDTDARANEIAAICDFKGSYPLKNIPLSGSAVIKSAGNGKFIGAVSQWKFDE